MFSIFISIVGNPVNLGPVVHKLAMVLVNES